MAAVRSTVVGNSHLEAVGVVQFEFWNGATFQMYSEEDQHVLQEALEAYPRPSEVSLAGGMYVIKGFDGVEHGKAVQMNTSTNFERIVRLKPPYKLGAHLPAHLPDGAFHFVFEDEQGEWQPYSQRLQYELSQSARCSPPPAQVFFVARGHSYWLVGLDRLSNGGGELTQQNLKTGKSRRVAMWSGEAPAAAARRAAFSASGAASSSSLATASSLASSVPGPITAPRLLGSAPRAAAEEAQKKKPSAPQASLVVPFVPGGPAAALAAYWWKNKGSETRE
eukprot:CAMPEP_0115610818 /NCGR_PEP_ID=MMETSP0272-20121206/20217_1 /TAXON_ID=71861 /ORGANISM="Scrippsiella trochoidea, Strain CCMP3099" /LENGTH=278 /DNA_ID=CAMNT_0003046539 /DNA_START=98 /DNA_END=934 /DNA_ORIENTATION=-